MSWLKGVLADHIRAKLFNGKTRFGNKAAYDPDLNFTFLDFSDDDDIPNMRAMRAFFGAFTNGLPVPFAAVGTVSIDWQTDNPPGFSGVNTYAAIFGNMYPKPYVYDDADNMIPFNLQANRVIPGDPTTNLTTVVFNFGLVATGTIQF